METHTDKGKGMYRNDMGRVTETQSVQGPESCEGLKVVNYDPLLFKSRNKPKIGAHLSCFVYSMLEIGRMLVLII